MDRYSIKEWYIESNEGTKSIKSDLTIYENSFLSIQNHEAGLSYEFHTYEALELTSPSTQLSMLSTSGEILGNSVNYLNPTDEPWCCSSYKGRIKPIHRHGTPVITPSTKLIPFDRLTSINPILWSSQLTFFIKSTPIEKSIFTVKFRLMQDCFYCLARMVVYARDDFIRILDTRVFKSFDQAFTVRHFSAKQSSIEELRYKNVVVNYLDINQLTYCSLNTVLEFNDEIIF
jgi:TIP41-like family